MHNTRVIAALAALILSGGAAQAADLMVDETAIEMAAPAPGDWTGAYVGASAGYASGNAAWSLVAPR